MFAFAAMAILRKRKQVWGSEGVRFHPRVRSKFLPAMEVLKMMAQTADAARLEAIDELARLERMAERILDVNAWDALLATP